MNRIIMGGQWGDEGKGKIVDLLSNDSNVVARYQGGANAGHTIYLNDKKIVLHQIPSGILQKNCICILGNGMVIDPIELCQEIDTIKSLNLNPDNIYISPNAHIVTPISKGIDNKNESKRMNKIGTTGKGIGPTYVDKYNRVGIRAFDIKNPDVLNEKYCSSFSQSKLGDDYSIDSKHGKDFLDSCKKINPYIKNIFPILHDSKNKILVEGAQGVLLDIDHGTYPFVTSSNPTIGGVSSGLGLPISKFESITGIFKAYVTRVGNGPFPTELKNEIGEKIQKVGKEFGATTGRPRRCGWFDSVAASFSIKLNGINEVVITKLDILSNLDEINVCINYQYKDFKSDDYSEFMNVLDSVVPIYKKMPGWKCDISDVTSFYDLPNNAKKYIKYLRSLLNCDIKIISVGPNRDQVIKL